MWHHHSCWGGGWLQDGQQEGEKAALEAPATYKKDEVFLSMDTDGDGELQLPEVTGLLASMNASADIAQEIFQEEDSDQSRGLSAGEFQEALDKWGTTCRYMQRSWFCSGGYRISCCRHGWFWRRCGSMWHHHSSWGGGWLQDGQQEGEKAALEAPATYKKDEVFLSMDTDGDGELQLPEVTGLLARMNASAEIAEQLFQEEDSDVSQGLSAGEFQEALEKWGGHCRYMQRRWFCSGGYRIRCCRYGLFWKRCGSVWHHHSCWHGPGWLQEGQQESEALALESPMTANDEV